MTRVPGRWATVLCGLLAGACSQEQEPPRSIVCPPGTEFSRATLSIGERLEWCTGRKGDHRGDRVWQRLAPTGIVLERKEYDENGSMHGHWITRTEVGDPRYRGGEEGVYVRSKREGEWLGWGPRFLLLDGVGAVPPIPSVETLQQRVNYRGDLLHGLATYYEADGITVRVVRCMVHGQIRWIQRGPGPAPQCDPDQPDGLATPNAP